MNFYCSTIIVCLLVLQATHWTCCKKDFSFTPPENNELCTRPDGLPGKCVDLYLCDDNFTIITDGRGEIHPRSTNPTKPKQWSFDIYNTCPFIVSTCCSMKTEDKMIPAKLMKMNMKESEASPKYTRNCGRRNPNGIGPHIPIHNNLSKIGEFPWMILIMQYNKTVNDKTIYMYECGGSLIHPKVVLTSANCVAGKLRLSARAGEWDTSSDVENIPHQTRNVVEVIIHEDYNADNLHNDIAILLLDSEFEERENVGVVCLASADFRPSKEHNDCYSSGWGKDSFGPSGVYQVALKKVVLPLVEQNDCQEKLRGRLGIDFVLDKSFICAGGIPGHDTCTGDGGSPLTCPMPKNPEVYVQLGIVSWGIQCGTKYPSVHANVIHLRHWIDDKLRLKNIDMNRYVSF